MKHDLWKTFNLGVAVALGLLAVAYVALVAVTSDGEAGRVTTERSSGARVDLTSLTVDEEAVDAAPGEAAEAGPSPTAPVSTPTSTSTTTAAEQPAVTSSPNPGPSVAPQPSTPAPAPEPSPSTTPAPAPTTTTAAPGEATPPTTTTTPSKTKPPDCIARFRDPILKQWICIL